VTDIAALAVVDLRPLADAVFLAGIFVPGIVVPGIVVTVIFVTVIVVTVIFAAKRGSFLAPLWRLWRQLWCFCR